VLEISTPASEPLTFSTDTLTAPAGTLVRVEYLNDSNVLHNITFFDGPDASAPRLAGTELDTGPGDLQVVEFTTPSEPGSYFFHCDVHPTLMTGTLEVTEAG
jgi:plastocyanin